MTPRTPNTRPTDAELVAMLRQAAELIVTLSPRDIRKSFYEKNFAVNTLGKAANALEAAGVGPPPLAHITTIRELFEVIDWDFDGSGLTVTDGNLLANTIANTFPALKNDMPHLVTTADEAGSLHRPDCSPDCSDHHRMINEAPYNDESYTVSGVD